jgi:hypothetical protein
LQLSRVQDGDLNWLAEQPESAMGVQLVLLQTPLGLRLVQVVGGLVVYDPQGYGEGLPLARWMSYGQAEEREGEFRTWLQDLPVDDVSLRAGSIVSARFVIYPAFPLPPAPVPPPVTFGHLPFLGTCDDDEVYYRWEAFPSSRRIDRATGKITPGTFTAPASEVSFVASGFGAVGRFALPNLSPANWRWELRPPAGTSFRCGASVPLYGQAGGGVEVEFLNGFLNVGPIANPFILPAL